jgi:hypothetical protein
VVDRSYLDDEIKIVLGKGFLRVFERVWGV